MRGITCSGRGEVGSRQQNGGDLLKEEGGGGAGAFRRNKPSGRGGRGFANRSSYSSGKGGGGRSLGKVAMPSNVERRTASSDADNSLQPGRPGRKDSKFREKKKRRRKPERGSTNREG